MRIVRYRYKNEERAYGWIFGNKVGDIEGDIFGEYQRLEAGARESNTSLGIVIWCLGPIFTTGIGNPPYFLAVSMWRAMKRRQYDLKGRQGLDRLLKHCIWVFGRHSRENGNPVFSRHSGYPPSRV